MAVILAIGAVMCLAGTALLLDAGGAGDFVMKHVTSRYVGSLAPGFANSKPGFRVYARLIVAIGIVFLGFAVADRFAFVGLGLLLAGVVAFAVLSVIAVRGELETYRSLKR